MYITSFSCAYIFLIIALSNLIISLYFRILVIKTSPDNSSREKIIGSMKDPITWRAKNNLMSYVSIIWAGISLAVFIYLKFFYTQGLISIIYLFAYIALIVCSLLIMSKSKKASI